MRVEVPQSCDELSSTKLLPILDIVSESGPERKSEGRRTTGRCQQVAALPKAKTLNLEEAASLLERAGELWERGTDEEKPSIAQSVFTKAWVREGKIIAVEPKPALYPLIEVARQAGLAAVDVTCGSDGRQIGTWSPDSASIWHIIVILPPGAKRPGEQ